MIKTRCLYFQAMLSVLEIYVILQSWWKWKLPYLSFSLSILFSSFVPLVQTNLIFTGGNGMVSVMLFSWVVCMCSSTDMPPRCSIKQQNCFMTSHLVFFLHLNWQKSRMNMSTQLLSDRCWKQISFFITNNFCSHSCIQTSCKWVHLKLARFSTTPS